MRRALTCWPCTRRAVGYLGAAIFGIGIGGLLTMLPLAWGDYFGRASYGAIRGIALSVQVLAQASGPLLSGMLRDGSGSYNLSLECFAVLAGLACSPPCWRVRRRRSPDLPLEKLARPQGSFTTK